MNRREEVVPIGPRRAPREYGSVYCGVASGPLEVKGTTAMRLRRCVLGVAVATMFVVFSIWPLISQASPLSTVRNRTVVNSRTALASEMTPTNGVSVVRTPRALSGLPAASRQGYFVVGLTGSRKRMRPRP